MKESGNRAFRFRLIFGPGWLINQRLLKDLRRISADEEDRYRALVRERAFSDAVTDRNAARRGARV